MNINLYPISVAVNGNEVYAVTAKTTDDQNTMIKIHGTVKSAVEAVIDNDSYIITQDGNIYGGYHSQYRGNGVTLHAWNKHGFDIAPPAICVALVAIRSKVVEL